MGNICFLLLAKIEQHANCKNTTLPPPPILEYPSGPLTAITSHLI
jgi:hypothetical protein